MYMLSISNRFNFVKLNSVSQKTMVQYQQFLIINVINMREAVSYVRWPYEGRPESEERRFLPAQTSSHWLKPVLTVNNNDHPQDWTRGHHLAFSPRMNAEPCSALLFLNLYWPNFLPWNIICFIPWHQDTILTLQNIHVNHKWICHQFVVKLHRKNCKLYLLIIY